MLLQTLDALVRSNSPVEPPSRVSKTFPGGTTCHTGRDYDPARCEVHLGQESYRAPASPGGIGHSDPGSHSHVYHETTVHASSIREEKGVRLLQGDMGVSHGRIEGETIFGNSKKKKCAHYPRPVLEPHSWRAFATKAPKVSQEKSHSGKHSSTLELLLFFCEQCSFVFQSRF